MFAHNEPMSKKRKKSNARITRDTKPAVYDNRLTPGDGYMRQ